MRYLGIDYGTKRIGVAVSDEDGKLAFPREILPNDRQIFEKLEELISNEKIAEVVIGEAEIISEKGQEFAKVLEKKLQVKVHTIREELTTLEARRYQSSQADARAAALILQRYLDRKNLI